MVIDGNFEGFLLDSNLSSQLMPSLIPTYNEKHKMSVHSHDDYTKAPHTIRLQNMHVCVMIKVITV